MSSEIVKRCESRLTQVERCSQMLRYFFWVCMQPMLRRNSGGRQEVRTAERRRPALSTHQVSRGMDACSSPIINRWSPGCRRHVGGASSHLSVCRHRPSDAVLFWIQHVGRRRCDRYNHFGFNVLHVAYTSIASIGNVHTYYRHRRDNRFITLPKSQEFICLRHC